MSKEIILRGWNWNCIDFPTTYIICASKYIVSLRFPTKKKKKNPFIYNINISTKSPFLSNSQRKKQRVMGKKKTWSLKKMSKELWPWRFSLFRRSPIDFQMIHFLIDNVFFKIVSVVEAIVLVSTLCFFLLCCGGHV